MTVPDLEQALYVDRSLVKHLAMRRTIFAFPRATLSFAQAGVSNRVADGERRRLIRDVEMAWLHRNGERWLSEANERPPRSNCASRAPCSRARSPMEKENPGVGSCRWGRES